MMNNTKIVCTIGPSSSTKDTMISLVNAGMTAARLNFSHGSHEEKKHVIKTLREVSEELKIPVTIIADLQGPKLRLGEIDGVREIAKGEKIVLSHQAEDAELPTQLDLSETVKKEDRILLNDGLVELVVEAVHRQKIHTTAKNAGVVSSFKGINIPDSYYGDGVLTTKDKEDLHFALEMGVHYVALSFVQSVEDIQEVRKEIVSAHKQCQIIAKIERKEATHKLEEIIKESDGVMIARGDLAIETSPADVPIVQLRIIRLARQFQKPVIVATQMLESMIENPRPTRAEATDIAHAVLYQVDAVMLSAESASGKYPVEAVHVMHEIIHKVEHSPEFKHYIKINWEEIAADTLKLSAITATASSFAHRVHASTLLVATASGRTARIISSFRPDAHIIAITHSEEVAHQLFLLWGVTALIVNATADNTSFWEKIAEKILHLGLAKKDDKVVMVSGSQVGISGDTDTIKIVTL